jgi:predicted Holliday junction resolvase-like endonuclease
MTVALLVLILALIAYIAYLITSIRLLNIQTSSRQEVIDDLLNTHKYHDELRDEVLSMIKADCTFEEITEYLQNT